MTTLEAIKRLKPHRSDSKNIRLDLTAISRMTGKSCAKVYGETAELNEKGFIKITRGKVYDLVEVLTPTEQFLEKLPELLRPEEVKL